MLFFDLLFTFYILIETKNESQPLRKKSYINILT